MPSMAHQLDPMYVKMRDQAFHWGTQAPEGALRGVIMETGYDRGVVTFAAMSDSSISIYFSCGRRRWPNCAPPRPAGRGCPRRSCRRPS